MNRDMEVQAWRSIVDYARSLVANADAYERVRAERVREIQARGFRIVSHTGGGNCNSNSVYDCATKEVLWTGPDDIDAMGDSWADDWWHVDAATEGVLEAADVVAPMVEAPYGLDDWDADEARRFLADIEVQS